VKQAWREIDLALFCGGTSAEWSWWRRLGLFCGSTSAEQIWLGAASRLLLPLSRL
jgi:hypothetical protein